MVQGGLLTVHPESIHGGGAAPGGGSSLRKGAGKKSAGAPDLGSTAAAEQRRDREKGVSSQKFYVTRNIKAKGGRQGGGEGKGVSLQKLNGKGKKKGEGGQPGGSQGASRVQDPPPWRGQALG